MPSLHLVQHSIHLLPRRGVRGAMPPQQHSKGHLIG
jgi:hypothetical protein